MLKHKVLENWTIVTKYRNFRFGCVGELDFDKLYNQLSKSERTGLKMVYLDYNKDIFY